jgi:hypothetical protein
MSSENLVIEFPLPLQEETKTLGVQTPLSLAGGLP